MKRAVSVIIAVIFALCFPVCSFAEEGDEDNMNIIMDDVSSQLEEYIDDDVHSELEENGIDMSNPESISGFSVSSILNYIFGIFSEYLGEPFGILGKTTALALICLLIKSIAPDSENISRAFSVTAVLCCVSISLDCINLVVDKILNSLDAVNSFMLSYIPVYASIIATSGSPSAASSYYITLFSVSEVITYIADKIFMPLISIVFAVSIVAAINPQLSLSSVSSNIKSLVQLLLGVLMTIFVGVLSMQSVIGISSDSVGAKAAKFAVSTFVPVVGGAVSDAYQTVKGSLGVIRSGVGGFGMIIILFIVIRPVIFTVIVRLVTMLGGIIADIMGEKELSSLLKSTSAVISIALSVIVTVSVVFIVSTAVLMLAGVNSN